MSDIKRNKLGQFAEKIIPWNKGKNGYIMPNARLSDEFKKKRGWYFRGHDKIYWRDCDY